jgi:hypothetical protein
MSLACAGKENEMNDDEKRINIEDLPKAAEELTDEEAKNVEGGGFGLTKAGPGTLQYGNPAPGNTIGGSLAVDPVDPSRKMGDGSV